MLYYSPYLPHEIVEILAEQIDSEPTALQHLFSFTLFAYKGKSTVCGKVSKNNFELRNRNFPLNSNVAHGSFDKYGKGTKLEIEFKKPNSSLAVRIPNRDKVDRKVILNFLKLWLELEEINKSASE